VSRAWHTHFYTKPVQYTAEAAQRVTEATNKLLALGVDLDAEHNGDVPKPRLFTRTFLVENPHTGQMETLIKGTLPPAWAAGLIPGWMFAADDVEPLARALVSSADEDDELNTRSARPRMTPTTNQPVVGFSCPLRGWRST